MPRARAGAAAKAFGRVGTAQVGDLPAGSDVSNDAGFSASDNAGIDDSKIAIRIDGNTAVITAGGTAGETDGQKASPAAGPKAGGKTGRKAGRKAGRPRRRVGRPRGPERVPLTIRILAATDARLTTAVEATGESPQYIVDKALAAYLDALGIPKA